MPIHQTKLMMSNAQPTGMLLPQMPMPLTTQVGRARPAAAPCSSEARCSEAEVPAERRLPREDDRADLVGDRCRTCAPARSPAACRCRRLASADLRWAMRARPSLAQLRIQVPHRRQIRRPRPRVQLGQQRVVALLGLQLRDAAVRIVQVAEDDRLGRAGLLAGGLDLAVARSCGPPSPTSIFAALIRCTQ